MLSYIKGNIKHINSNYLIILTESGIGYEITINEYIYSKLLDKNDIEMFLHHVITENNQALFGFLEIEDKDIFKELIKISGIGGRVAQNILSLSTEKLKTAIIQSDKKTIESIKGVGKKMAEKIILELSDKKFIKNFSPTNHENKINNFSLLEADLKNDITQTLNLMGYNPKKVESLLNSLPKGYNTAENIIPYIIKNI